jgi:methionyl-tRNA synthetase
MTSDFQRILVTAALPYANGLLHLGHLAGAYLPADIYVRYQRACKRDVLFLCGSDEHGVAITVTAEQEKITPKQVIDRYHPLHQKAFEEFGMSFDNYSRTSLPLHHETTREFFLELYRRNVLKEKQEQQLYCEKDKIFLADRYVEGTCPNCRYPQARGDQCENCGSWLNQTDLIEPRCKLCGSAPVVRTTTHLYFPLGQFQERLEAYIAERARRDGWKENVLRYCESWFKKGLEDRAVTRDLSWGVPVPVQGYENKVVYVWFDAVLGYISSAKEWAARRSTPDAWRQYWQDRGTKYVAFIGKDNVVFHCIVFPAMLMAWNDGRQEQYVLPENVPANEFLNFGGQKFSKSRGWGIDVLEFLKYFPADTLRYSLAVNLPEYRDSDFYLNDFQARTNNELADILGNFVNRTLAFIGKNFGGVVPRRSVLSERDRRMIEQLEKVPSVVGACYEEYRFRDGVMESMNLARSANKYFNDSEPWKTVKSNSEQCATALNICVQIVRALAILFRPITPAIAERIWRLLNLPEPIDSVSWESAGKLLVPDMHRVEKAEPLVKKIEDGEIETMTKELGMTLESAGAGRNIISIDDFKKIDLRVAKVITAERIPKSERLVKLQIEMGTERRQIIAGIAEYYQPEALVGRSIIVVANLQPAKLMGYESQGMLLAANDSNGRLSIVTVLDEIASGSVVK